MGQRGPTHSSSSGLGSFYAGSDFPFKTALQISAWGGAGLDQNLTRGSHMALGLLHVWSDILFKPAPQQSDPSGPFSSDMGGALKVAIQAPSLLLRRGAVRGVLRALLP